AGGGPGEQRVVGDGGRQWPGAAARRRGSRGGRRGPVAPALSSSSGARSRNATTTPCQTTTLRGTTSTQRGRPGGRNAMPGGGNRVARCDDAQGWRDAAQRGSEDPSAVVGRCAERGARANPPPGATPVHASDRTPNLRS